MAKQYQITKLINNNIVFSQNEGGEEIILFGKAIGFGKKKGDVVEESQVLKAFSAVNQKEKNFIVNLVEDISPVYINIASEIISLFESRLQVEVNDMMLISLSDHISNAVQNKKEGIELPLDIIQEVKSIYPREFLTANEGLDCIEKNVGVRLGEDEAGYIVLHYINAQGKAFRSDAKYRLLFQEKLITNIEEYYHMKLDRSSLYYTRFLTHLSFLAARIHDGEILSPENSTIYKMIIAQYPDLEGCVREGARIIYNELNVEINDEEKGYLAIHIKNMLKSMQKGMD